MRTPMATIPQLRTKRRKRVSLVQNSKARSLDRAFCLAALWLSTGVVACDKREAFAQGSASDEAIQSLLRSEVDCFASLAMTVSLLALHLAGMTVARLFGQAQQALSSPPIRPASPQSTTIFTRSRTLTWAWASSPLRMRKRSTGRSTAAMRCASDSTVSPGCAVMTFIRSGRAA